MLNNAVQEGRSRDFSSLGMATGDKSVRDFDRNNKMLIRVAGKLNYQFLPKRNYAECKVLSSTLKTDVMVSPESLINLCESKWFYIPKLQ